MPSTRRGFLTTSLGILSTSPWAIAAAEDARPSDGLHGEIGITTGTFSHQLRTRPERFRLPELLAVIRGELDLRVVDVYTPSLDSFDAAYLERVRAAAEKAGCVLTNLKMNQPGLDLGSADPPVRDKALAEYKRSIDAAARLGMRWARPLPTKERPDRRSLIAALRELADYAARREVRLLIENFGWMQSDPDSVIRLVKEIGHNVAASPDTGNWANNEVRYEGLARTFPHAVTCDFKARALGPGGEHEAYDLKRCFSIGWDTGFRGPWCLEHGHADEETLLRELRTLRDRLRQWMSERT
jgi:hypothetical protein